MAGVLTASVVLALVLPGRGGHGDVTREVRLQGFAEPGDDRFTDSTDPRGGASVPPAARDASPGAVDGPAAHRGTADGLYGGTRNVPACEVERQISRLGATPAKNKAFAVAAGVEPVAVPRYLRSLTPLRLVKDAWVTDHGYRGGEAYPYQAVLQAGTAVLVDRLAVPRVRCACGNPLSEPLSEPDGKGRYRTTGHRWPGFSLARTVRVKPAEKPVDTFVVVDLADPGRRIARPAGGTGHRYDRTAPSPAAPTTGTATTTRPATASGPVTGTGGLTGEARAHARDGPGTTRARRARQAPDPGGPVGG
ncbi:DUF6777 domain-containing protein, partial [Streptomyces sp. NRRL S-118]|uniref:DUF6777 domain-containing protein n=1 Tax=Streptomyces sp. NRRL S-118 TaxID=1463881 RepID=UPI0018FE1C47